MQRDRSRCSEIEAVEELVEKNGLSVLSARDEWGYTPAHWAALDGNVEVSFERHTRCFPFNDTQVSFFVTR